MPLTYSIRSLLAVALCVTVGTATATAAKPGGGGTTPPARFSVVSLPVVDRSYKVTNVDANGYVTVIGNGSESGNNGSTYASAAFARVHVPTRTAAGALLPEPTDGLAVDAGSTAYDVTASGVIVGTASVFEDGDTTNHVSKPIRWVPNGASFSYELLPLQPGDRFGTVNAINEAGWMVGYSGDDPDIRHETLWSPEGTAFDLLSLLPAGSGWTALYVDDINNLFELVGHGHWNGTDTGFVISLDIGIDSESGDYTFASVIEPLVPPAGVDRISPILIHDTGVIVGIAVFPDGSTLGTFQANAAAPVELLLPPSTGTTAAYGANTSSSIVGNTFFPNVDPGSAETFKATLWEPLPGGGFKAMLLETLIPSKPSWIFQLGFALNEQGCISAYGRKYEKGKYTWTGVLLVPNP